MCRYKQFRFNCSHEDLQLVTNACGEFRKQTNGRSLAYATFRCPFSTKSPAIETDIPCCQCHSSYMKSTSKDPWPAAYSAVIILFGEDDVILHDLDPRHQVYYELLKTSPCGHKNTTLQEHTLVSIRHVPVNNTLEMNSDVNTTRSGYMTTITETSSEIETIDTSIPPSMESSRSIVSHESSNRHLLTRPFAVDEWPINAWDNESVKSVQSLDVSHDLPIRTPMMGNVLSFPSCQRGIFKRIGMRGGRYTISNSALRQLKTSNSETGSIHDGMTESSFTSSHHSSIDSFHTAVSAQVTYNKLEDASFGEPRADSAPNLTLAPERDTRGEDVEILAE